MYLFLLYYLNFRLSLIPLFNSNLVTFKSIELTHCSKLNEKSFFSLILSNIILLLSFLGSLNFSVSSSFISLLDSSEDSSLYSSFKFKYSFSLNSSFSKLKYLLAVNKLLILVSGNIIEFSLFISSIANISLIFLCSLTKFI